MGESKSFTVTEVGDDAGCHCLFAGAKVHFPGDQAPVPEVLDGELERARPQHLAVQIRKFHGRVEPRITLSFEFRTHRQQGLVVVTVDIVGPA